MNRRAFFGTVLGGFVAAVAPKPTFTGWTSRLWSSGYDPATRTIVIRKMMARVRITEEAMADARSGVFTDAARREVQGLVTATARAEEAALFTDHDRRPL